MKKIFLTIFATGALLTSCDMNELPAGSLSDETAIQTLEDATNFRNGIYNNIRGISAGTAISRPEIQADLFIGTIVNGNQNGSISLGSITSSTTDIAGFWSAPYSAIAAVNYFLPRVESLLSNENISDDARITLERYRGEAHWARAYYYYFLTEKYCNSYTVVDPNAADTGVPLVTEYHPSGDYATYPGRATLAEVYTQIEKDLDIAYTDLDNFEKSGIAGADENLQPNAAYLSTYTVTALQARIALLKGEWDKALAKAEILIGTNGSSPFSLTDDMSYDSMWTSDEGDELIFVPFGNQTQASAVPDTGSAWLTNSNGVYLYVPTSTVLSLYDQFDDIRYDSFFRDAFLLVNGETVLCPSFVKFPGNPVFNTGSSNAFRNKPKPFRLSEMYLIAAEAAAMSSNNQTAKANKYLNDLRRARIYAYADENHAGQELIDAIRVERCKELIGEGFRISDLRRWGLGFTRKADYTGAYSDLRPALVAAGINVRYTPGDYRFVLPIPTNEMDTNPQLKGHQNPGY